MIIVIGKKDKQILEDAQVYIRERGEQYLWEPPFGEKECGEDLARDCFSIANRIRKVVGLPSLEK